ncbi:MAG: glycosyltransferase family 9 protein [Nitrospinota bacterium]|nr:glycosyltransferase family 9 protein [Nitrospinota bacterium]MDH5677914.1 glycosyltransferase family 9 protein [Nitrospinota bacterium]MDH5756185.1 glycosyltransferase family 9 protein [Nitrospinota bacterium]
MFSSLIKLPEKPRILVVRTDRIGDMVLSLPVFASLRHAMPGAFIAALARDYTKELLEGRDDVDEIISFPSPGAHVPTGMIWGLGARLRSMNFDAAILLYLKSSVALCVALARIPVRIGPATKIAQALLTHRIRQRRSRSLTSEADHNLALLSPLGVEPVREARIVVDGDSPGPFVRRPDHPLVGLHPGHGGSARTWPVKRWEELARLLAEAGMDVAVTGAPAEKNLVDQVAAAAGPGAQKYIGGEGLKKLARALYGLDALVAPSTGPLHIASATGTPAVGIYCPIFVCLPERWGPIGPGGGAIRPDVSPCDYCLGSDCPHFDCMESISAQQVMEQVRARLRPARVGAR